MPALAALVLPLRWLPRRASVPLRQRLVPGAHGASLLAARRRAHRGARTSPATCRGSRTLRANYAQLEGCGTSSAIPQELAGSTSSKGNASRRARLRARVDELELRLREQGPQQQALHQRQVKLQHWLDALEHTITAASPAAQTPPSRERTSWAPRQDKPAFHGSRKIEMRSCATTSSVSVVRRVGRDVESAGAITRKACI